MANRPRHGQEAPGEAVLRQWPVEGQKTNESQHTKWLLVITETTHTLKLLLLLQSSRPHDLVDY